MEREKGVCACPGMDDYETAREFNRNLLIAAPVKFHGHNLNCMDCIRPVGLVLLFLRNGDEVVKYMERPY